MKIQQLTEVVRNHRLFIQTHNFPDPDAIASAFGLQSLLRKYGIESTICYEGTIEKLSATRLIEAFNIRMFNIAEISDMSESDYIITIDAQKYNKNLTDFPGDEVACIDHHPMFVDCVYKFRDIRITGACSTLVAEYFCEANEEIPEDVATALLYGIKMDTMDLRRGVTALDIEMFGRLFTRADQDTLTYLQTNTMEFNDLHAYGAAIESIKVYDNLGFAYIPFNCPDGLIAMVSEFILSLDVIEFSVIYAHRPEGFKFSVRSELPSLDAGKITGIALSGIGGGGGHAMFAGGFVPETGLSSLTGDFHENIRARFTDAIEQYKKSRTQ